MVLTAEPFFYDVISSAFGPVAVVWWRAPSGPRVRQIFLCGKKAAAGIVREKFAEARVSSSPAIDRLGDLIQRFLEGQAVVFDLASSAMEACGEFQRKVLLAEYGIPRGWVSTYGRLARHVGAEGGGRAAGRALAQNPFPIIIPCHRAIKADGGLGGYQGGTKMKRALLEMEGVIFTASGRACMEKTFY
jgi:methylated-DNA-[protein]-cysteine S-methyltransferase